MSQLINLTKRNIKVYFSDKGMFFTSLITPIILLVLYHISFGKAIFSEKLFLLFFMFFEKLEISCISFFA